MTTAAHSHDAPAHETASCKLDDCRFCALERGGADLVMELYGEQPTIDIPGLPEEFQVLHCAFPIGERGCHLLLVPRRHYRSLAAFPNQELVRQASKAVTETLQQMYPDRWLFVFEHGPGEIDSRQVKCGGCHVDHAHGHFLAFSDDVDFEDILDATEGALEDLDWDLDEQRHESTEAFTDIGDFSGEKPYLHLGRIANDKTEIHTFKQLDASRGIPSQLLRKLAAAAAGHPEPTYWNWKIALQQNLTERIHWFGDAVRTFKADFARHVA